MVTSLKSLLASLLLLASTLAQEETTKPCEDMELLKLPSAYATTIMMNIQLGREKGFSISLYEAADNNLGKSFISAWQEINVVNPITNLSEPRLLDEMILFNPELSGIDYFIDVYSGGSDGLYGQMCDADKVRDGSILEWMFGWSPGSGGLPSVSGLLHAGGEYTAGCPGVFRGVEVNTFRGKWNISAWDALLDVKYYWSNPEKWYGSAGRGVSVPVSAVVEGDATILGMGRDHIKIEIDYSDFIEISLPREFYYPPSDLWCSGRSMEDGTPEVPSEISYTEEIVMKWLNSMAEPIDVILTRNVWLDYDRMITRTDYKPVDDHATDPFDGNTRNVQQIDDFLTGLSYTISQDFGNCSVDYLLNDQTGTVVIHDHHVHIRNPFFLMNFAKFAFTGEYHERGIEVDSFMRNSRPPWDHSVTDNDTTVFYLSSSNWEIEDGEELPERLIPTKVITYPTSKYNDPFLNVKMNIFHFSKVSPDFSLYDISACFEENQMMHLMVRMGWHPDMDIENTRKLFNDEVRNAVTLWGRVTHIRVVNIEFDIDFANSAVFVIWTVLDYPRNFDVELGDIPDAIRPLPEIKDNIQSAVDKGLFTVKVEINDGKGGTIRSQAETGSLRELGERGQDITHKSGYRAGSMAALGIVMLVLTVGGILALLVFVLKW